MKRDQNKRIEAACEAAAKALALLVAAVLRHPLDDAKSRPITGVISKAAEGALKSIVTDSVVIAKANFQAGYRSNDARRIFVYLAGSSGCATLARTYGARIMGALGLDSEPYVIKCGTTTADLAARLRQIGQDGYGAAIRTESGIELEPGFKAWIAHAISTSRQPRDPAVKLMPRVISVDLPPGLTRRAFDAALHRALKGRALTNVPSNEVPRRYVAYDLVETRISAATELYAMSPHECATGDLLLDAIETILGEARAKRA